MSVRKSLVSSESSAEPVRERRLFPPPATQFSPESSGLLDRAIRRALATKPKAATSGFLVESGAVDSYLSQLQSGLFGRWPEMDSAERRNWVQDLVSRQLSAQGVPAVAFERPIVRGDLYAEFNNQRWTMKFDNFYFLAPQLSPLEEIHLANTVAHECGHAIHCWLAVCALVHDEELADDDFEKRRLDRWFPRSVFERARVKTFDCNSTEATRGLEYARIHFSPNALRQKRKDAKGERKAILAFEKAVENVEKRFRQKKDATLALDQAIQAFSDLLGAHEPLTHTEINQTEKRLTATYLESRGIKSQNITPLLSHWPLFEIAFAPEFRDQLPSPLGG